MKTAEMKVSLINAMGNDLTVVNAARVSFDKESDWNYWRDDDGVVESYLKVRDAKLIQYLAKHNHWTPFGHIAATFRIKAPIFVARQLGKHQVGLVWNEVSRRYVNSQPEFFFPRAWRKQAENVKQGSSETETIELFSEGYAEGGYRFPTTMTEAAEGSVRYAAGLYKMMVDKGVCPEQARMVLPQNMMTEWVWTGSVAAFARVCKLRLDPHTQAETREIATAMSAELSKAFPISWDALLNNPPL